MSERTDRNPSPGQGEVAERSEVGGGGTQTRGKSLTPRQKQNSSVLRQSTTEAEGLLWWRLRDFRGNGCAFRRQVAVGPYIADFLCRKANLIVELDGEHHAGVQQRQHDETRDAWLTTQGYSILRFWNGDVFKDLNSVLDAIEAELRQAGVLT